MRAGAGLALLLTACDYTPPRLAADAAPEDADVDVIDSPVSLRVQEGLVGFWTFDEAAGSVIANDTSGSGLPVPIDVETSPTIFPPTFGNGEVTTTVVSRMISVTDSHLASDCIGGGGVTLEAWVQPASASQGIPSEPRFIAGLARNVGLRNVVLLQMGDKWLGRVRTSAAQDGTPNLVSSTTANPSKMTHLVLVADASQRILYVDDVPEASDTPGPLTGWDPSYAMALFDEPQHARQWFGTFALVALYNRALSADEVHQNFELGPTAP